MDQVTLPAHTFATLSQAAQAAESHEWERAQQFPERLREILAVLRGVPAPQGDAAREQLAALLLEEVMSGEIWREITPASRTRMAYKLADALMVRGVSVGGASSSGSAPSQGTPIQELAQAAEDYLLAEMHVGVPEDTLRRLNHRLGALAGPHLVAYQASGSAPPNPGDQS